MEDLRTLYNQLTIFNKETVLSNFPLPIKVQFIKENNALFFEQKGQSLYTNVPVYYSLGLVEDLYKSPSWLTPEGYIDLMENLQYVIGDSHSYLLQDRTCLSPENYGFDIYYTNNLELWKGPERVARIRFVDGVSWFFKWRVSRKYKLELVNYYRKDREDGES